MNTFTRSLIGAAMVAGMVCSPGTDANAANKLSREAESSSLLPQPRQWRHASRQGLSERRARRKVVTESDSQIGPVNSFGTLYSPTGSEWTYTSEITAEEGKGYTGAKLTIYDESNKVLGTIDTKFELSGKETGVNLVEINPNISRKFFNVDDKYEVILYIHATTSDYVGSVYQLIFAVAPDQTEPLMRVEGNQVLRENLSTDSWTEKYQMVMMREVYEGDDFFIAFDVYGHANYDSMHAPRLLHTFNIDYSTVADMGGNGLPIALRSVGGKPMYAIGHYEKPYFDPASSWEDPTPTPDNNMLIDVYDGSKFTGAADADYAPEYTVTIPIEQKEGYLYSFPTLGAFSGNNDFSFGMFSDDPTEPFFIITTENYAVSSDDFIDDFKVYNREGQLVNTIAEDVEGYMELMPIAGQNPQYCVYNSTNDEYFHIIELPSCQQTAAIPFVFEGAYLSTAIDRVPAPGGYQYAIARTQGVGLPNGDIIHSIGYFNPDGSFSHWDDINLGSTPVMAQVAIVGEWLNPYLFNTDNSREYMFIVKVPSAANPNRMEEHLWIRNADGKNLLDFGPDEKLGGELTTVMISNATSNAPALVTVFNKRDYDSHLDNYTLNFNSLPLTKFEGGGDGTPENPYVITAAGDLMQIGSAPSAHYVIANDIDFEGQIWSGITEPFTGTLDGQGHVVSNLHIEGAGMFGDVIGTAIIKNLVLYNPQATPTGPSAGFVAANMIYDGETAPVIENVRVFGGKASGAFDDEFGAIVGNLTTGSALKACSAEGTVIDLAHATVGGIVGSISSSGGDINACAFSGTISGATVGGIVGSANAGNVKDCHSVATLTGSHAVGGVMGFVGTYMDYRPLISNCFASCDIISTNPVTAQAGGVAGDVEEGDNITITNNVVAVTLAFADGAKPTAHNIAGHTCGDDLGAIDWESSWWETTENPYEHPEDWPRLPSEPDNGIINNYALTSSTEPLTDTEEPSAVDGTPITRITQDFLTNQGWSFGATVDAPWDITDELCLYYQLSDVAILADHDAIKAMVDDEVVVTFTKLGGSKVTTIESSNPDVATVTNVDYALVDGAHTYRATIKIVGEGTADIVATGGQVSARCAIDAKSSGVAEVAAPTHGITFDGQYVRADGQVTIYNITGARVASGVGHVNVKRLAPGVYVAVSGAGESRKILIR